jgi:long-chain fatty acid transport protein
MKLPPIIQFSAPLLLVITASQASANGFRLADQDAAATARGEAFVATADNASAVYYNPAGITQLTNTTIRSGIYGINLQPTFQPPAGQPNSGKTYGIGKNYAAVPQFFATHTLEKWPVSFGVGFYAPYGGAISWPDDTRFRSVAKRSSLFYLRFSPVVAVKLSDTLSIGAGVSVDYARLLLKQGILKGVNPPNEFTFQGDGFSAGYNAGILWQPIQQLSLGATTRGANDFSFGGKTDFVEDGAFPAGSRAATMDLTFPLTTTFGISYRPTPKWNLEFDADYTGWDSIGQTTIHQTPAPPSGIQPNIPVTLNWKPSWLYELGVTRYFDNGWHVSAGYVFDQNSVTAEF